MHFFTFFVKIFNFSKIILKNLISYSVVNQLIMIFKVKKITFFGGCLEKRRNFVPVFL
jgi:hypothetical protein